VILSWRHAADAGAAATPPMLVWKRTGVRSATAVEKADSKPKSAQTRKNA